MSRRPGPARTSARTRALVLALLVVATAPVPVTGTPDPAGSAAAAPGTATATGPVVPVVPVSTEATMDPGADPPPGPNPTCSPRTVPASTGEESDSRERSATGDGSDADERPSNDDASDAGGRPANGTPRIVAMYPNPVVDGDRAEFVVLRVPEGSRTGAWTLADGEATVAVPAGLPAGRVALSPDPATVRNLTGRRVVGVGTLELANDGERVTLAANGTVVDAVRYERAPEGEVWHARGVGRWRAPTGTGPSPPGTDAADRPVDDATWRPLGADPRPVGEYGPANATAFVLPDSPAVVLQTLRDADRRLLLAGYTLTSGRVADALVAAARRGVTVRVLVEGGPVGGITAREAAVLDRLAAAGVGVEVVDGPRARVRFHHAKYAVVDDRALVLTENWKPAGVGGRDSRGWGVRVDSSAVAADLAALFRDDAGWHDTTPWRRFRAGRRFAADDGPANGTYPSRIAPRSVEARCVRVLAAPGNAEAAVVDLLDDATTRVDIVQPTVDADGPFVRAALRAAGRGVRVRILLSGAWYVAEDNRETAARLNDRADGRGLPLEVRIADPRGRYGKVHAKGLVVDRVAVVGSMNWNDVSARENREVLLALEGTEPAAYYRDAFEADWRASGGTGGTRGRLPLGLVVAVLVGVGVAGRVARDIEFEGTAAGRGDPVDGVGHGDSAFGSGTAGDDPDGTAGVGADSGDDADGNGREDRPPP